MKFLDGIKADVKISGTVKLDITINQEDWDNFTMSEKKKLLRFVSDVQI